MPKAAETELRCSVSSEITLKYSYTKDARFYFYWPTYQEYFTYKKKYILKN